ncbi:transposable element Tcb2 transposase [Trichonephila clavipes]|nr:transposable element Tcb2 transposase [Trichonephila clavipes]
MSYYNCLEYSLRWRDLVRLEEARWSKVVPKVVSWLCNQFQASGNVSRKTNSLQTSNRDSRLRSASSSVCLFDYIKEERPVIVQQRTSVVKIARIRHIIFSNESRFIKLSDSSSREKVDFAFILPTYLTEIDTSFGKSNLVWEGIMLNSRPSLHVFDAGTVNTQRFWDEVLETYVRLLRGTMSLWYTFMDDNERSHRAHIVSEFLKKIFAL